MIVVKSFIIQINGQGHESIIAKEDRVNGEAKKNY